MKKSMEKDQLDIWLEKLITFNHLSRKDIIWYSNELSRRFNFPRDALIKLFKREGLPHD